MQTKYDSLKVDNENLQQQYTTLKLEYDQVMKENEDLKRRVTKLEERLDESKTRGHGIDIRKAMRSLENWIAVDVVGGKKKVKLSGLYTLHNW